MQIEIQFINQEVTSLGGVSILKKMIDQSGFAAFLERLPLPEHTVYTQIFFDNFLRRCHRLRWLIEDLFRTLKTKGLNYESSELETGKTLRKLLIMALMTAVRILQLRQSRNGKTQQKLSLVFSEEQLACMDDILPHFEGKTERLKNPYPRNNLAWAVWLIARMGGWKGYTPQRPPGVVILHDGWMRFHNIFQGWIIAKKMCTNGRPNHGVLPMIPDNLSITIFKSRIQKCFSYSTVQNGKMDN